MRTRPSYYWRLAATGGCFAAFGVGGVILSTTILPATRLFPRQQGCRYARWLIHKSFAAFVWLLQAMGVMRLEVKGGERLRDCRGMLILANHPTLIDVVVLVSLMPEASCIVKNAVWRNPFFGGVVRAADYVNNSSPETLIDDCASHLAAGKPLLVFPEGTRSVPGTPLHFQRGAAYIALKSRAPILPVLLHCDPPTLMKSAPWYRIPARPFRLRVDVLEPIEAPREAAGSPDDPPAVAGRKLTQALETHFTRELERHGYLTA